ncbi:MAG TPA: DUF4105 domain-containing protein [Rhodanobacteraceae bacterium]|nr:DUF4105 domain-containing protein [Rhodanobacteraceae bacterium]
MPILDRATTLAFLSLLALATWAAPAHADVAHATGEELRVDLYTYGPGAVYWERFGHDALVLTDVRDGEAIAFNYGLFDFDQKDFFLNFARGRMNYMAAAWPAADDVSQYEQEGRWIEVQRLDLAPAQRAALRDFLVWNVQPQHARYAYDYYTSNCTTRIRDALDHVLDGALRAQAQPQARDFTYRSQTDRLMANQPWLMLLLDLGLGPYADQRLDGWSGSFLPQELMQTLRTARTAEGRPMVLTELNLSRARLLAPPAEAPDLRWPLFAAGAGCGIALALCAWLRRRHRIARAAFAFIGTAYALLAGIAGTLMLVLWLATTHHSAWANENLLLFNPLAWLLVPALLRTRRPTARADRFATVLAAAFVLAALIALAGHLSGWLPQRNLPWILFALPAWIGLAAGVRSALPRVAIA